MDPIAALGIMSSVGSSGQANAEQYASRRAHARESLQLFASATSSIQVRFILARPPVQPQAIRDEERRHGDMAWLSMNESRFRCALKPLLWYEYCLTAFPTARPPPPSSPPRPSMLMSSSRTWKLTCARS